MGYTPWGRKESDMSEQQSKHTTAIGEQYDGSLKN